MGRYWRQVVSPGTLSSYCLQPTKPNVVTITFPDGRVYKFQAVTAKQCQAVAPIDFARFTFTPMPGTRGSLVPQALLYAKNDRERLAAGVSMLFTLAGVGYGIYKVANLPSKAKGGNWLPASKEHMGTFLSEAEAAFRGEVVVAREVALQPSNGPAVRLDFVTRNLFGRLKGVESKFGPDARSTPNQRVSYPLLRANGGIVNAQNGGGAGWTQGMKIGPLEILVDWWSRRPPQDGSP